jgi:hypothetical protein
MNHVTSLKIESVLGYFESRQAGHPIWPADYSRNERAASQGSSTFRRQQIVGARLAEVNGRRSGSRGAPLPGRSESPSSLPRPRRAAYC